MKNSTLVKIIIIGLILGVLLYKNYKMVLGISIITILLFSIVYLVFCAIDYGEFDVIDEKYNIFYIIGGFFRWLDSKPKVIKTPKKYWRAPEDWDKEI